MTMELKHRTVAFKSDRVGDDGTFSGYASVFGNVDSYGEIVMPGAFQDSLARLKESGDPLPALWQHRAGEPIGGYDTLSEDSRGLKVDGWLLVDTIPRAREAHALMKRRVVKGMSIGYFVEESSMDEKTGIRSLLKLDLQEISVVTFPANSLALVEAVKANQITTIREFEGWLRDAGGFSAQRAKAIAAAGWNAADEARDESGAALKQLGEVISSFRLPTIA